MPLVNETFRIHYVAKGFETGLTDVRMVVYKPNGNKIGIYTLSELNSGDGNGIYYYDFVDADIEGTYLFIIDSQTRPLKDAKQQYFSSRPSVWSESEKQQIRDALGIDGTKIESVSGKLQQLLSDTNDIKIDINTLINDVNIIKNIESGKWEIKNNQMIFYADDNITELMRFNLYDENGIPAEKDVMKRVKV